MLRGDLRGLKGKALLLLFWILLPIIVRLVSMQYPFIVSVNITEASINGNVLHLEGTITIDPKKIPENLKKYYNNGVLEWWEQDINDVIKQNKFWRKFIHVEGIDLWWISKGVNEYDVIGFKVNVSVTIGK